LGIAGLYISYLGTYLDLEAFGDYII
jgi:hypothetical protein